MNIVRKHYGTIELGSKVTLSDPCYEADIWSSAQLSNLLPGIYDCYADFSDMGDWGTRVARLIIVSENPPHEAPSEIKEVNAFLSVDAGVFGIFDTEYYRQKKDENPEGWYENNVCSWISKEDAFICEEAKGFITTSGFGDGCYEAFCHLNDDGEIYKIEVIFLRPEEKGFVIIEHVDNETELCEIKKLLKAQ